MGPGRGIATRRSAERECFGTSLSVWQAEASRFARCGSVQKSVEDPELRPDAQVSVPGDGTLTGAYLLYARDYHPEQVAAQLGCPILVVQGGRDYQVTADNDFPARLAALKNAPRAGFRLYPKLDHLFVAGDGPSSPAQYAEPNHVDVQVISDIAAWVSFLEPR